MSLLARLSYNEVTRLFMGEMGTNFSWREYVPIKDKDRLAHSQIA